MKRDQEKREQLEKNMKERDAARTRRLMEAKLSKKDEEEMIRRSKALEDDDTSDLRIYSRQAYLQKRVDQKLLEIQDDIIDNEYIFEGVKLTTAEERELRCCMMLLRLLHDVIVFLLQIINVLSIDVHTSLFLVCIILVSYSYMYRYFWLQIFICLILRV